MTSAYLLVAHGSRDPRPQAALDRLAGIVREQLQATDRSRTAAQSQRSQMSATALSLTPSFVQHNQPILLETAILECGPLPLHEQIEQFASQLISAKIMDLQIVPLFLLPGVHVMEDIPAEVEIAQERLNQMGGSLKIAIRPYLGTHPRMVSLLKQQSHRDATGRVLLSHGSRRTGSQEVVERLAAQQGAVAAYWSTPPSLETQVEQFVYAGHTTIAVQPYFLFAGGIIDAIAQQVDQLSQQFETVTIHLMESLGPTLELADLVIDLMEPDRLLTPVCP